MNRKHVQLNQRTWDKVAGSYYGHSALPHWGPYEIGSPAKDLIGPIRGKTFLELGCGSGHSLRYLLRKGARHVSGVDFSKTQIAYAAELNRKALTDQRVTLWQKPMEAPLPLKNIDVAFSIFALGWSTNIPLTLKCVYRYLKPNGAFVMSWEHPAFRHIDFVHHRYSPVSPYWQDDFRTKRWKGKFTMIAQFPTIASWHHLLTTAGFRILRILEPRPRRFPAHLRDRTRHYANAKAKLVPPMIIFDCRKNTR
ncbi:MAG: class I SAM-dependent methyltransferase [Candidatus Kerfeldbacteria bacterium]|nr:class I SAM-dependent methyltransferase [Candidatus Kerfeldbacteria bacterium]